MLPNEKFKIVVGQNNGKTVVQLNGTIDEDASFDSIPKNLPEMVVNFKNVISINSCGVRAWVNLMKELANAKIHYQECPPMIVRQMNMVPSFVSHAQVSSVYVPYICDKCNNEFIMPAQNQQFQKGQVTVPESVSCPKCNTAAESEEPNDLYFAFMK
jgi:DNA-directed RNA polymerase subunit RPC12/RpoP